MYQIDDGSLSREWGGDIYHVLCEHASFTDTAPVLQCLDWCVHRHKSLAVFVCVCMYIYITFKCACPPLSHFHSPTASLTHVLLLLGKPFTGTDSPSTTGFSLNILTTRRPQLPMYLMPKCVCVCTVQYSLCLCDSSDKFAFTE